MNIIELFTQTILDFDPKIPNQSIFFLMIFFGFLYKFQLLDRTYKHLILFKLYLYHSVFCNYKKVEIQEIESVKEIPVIKFEDKYREEYKNLSYDYYFSQEEKELLIQKNDELKEKGEEYPEEKASEYIFREKIKKLNNTFVMEYTPMGNIILTFNIEKEHFEYYSDATVPYRFLETVARKFVIQNNCKSIFIDMNDELKIYEENLKKIEDKKEAERKEAERKELDENYKAPKEKKNVFAKLKTYNNDLVTNRMGATQSIPPKQSRPTTNISQPAQSHKVILKEKSNSYSYKGKLQNFNILKKIDKSSSSKKMKLSFAEYKNLMKSKQLENKNKEINIK